MNKLYKIALIGLLGVLALAIVACGGVANAAPPTQGGTPVPGSNAPTTDIGVTGTGRVFGSPDTAIATVGMDITGPTLTSASSDASTKMKAVLDKIKSLGVDPKDIQTVNYSVNPITSNPKEGETPRITGYHVSNIVQIKIRKLDQVGTILDGAMGAGANSLNGLYYTIDDPTALTQQARAKAVADALAKAQTLADAAKVKLGPIISITENVSNPRPITVRSALPAAMDAAGSGIGPVESGQNEIDVSVEMHWQISQ